MRDRSLLLFSVLAVVAGVACIAIEGRAVAREAVADSFDLLVGVLPQLVAGLLLGGFVQVLVPREVMSRLLGEKSGIRGLLLASVAGAATPGGPFASFPIVFALWQAGVDAGALVCYVTAWTVLGVHRLLIWELPFMGVEFAVVRYAASLPLPIVAGLIARRIARRFPLPRADRTDA